jgi:ABC-type dipeptide/oligopeptide/nickel transport system permease component
MHAYFGKRLIHTVFVLFGVTVLSFFLMHLSGDPTGLLLPPGATEEDRVEFSRRMGFDKPLMVQYKNYLFKALQGDFGKSYYFHQPVMKLIADRIPASVELNSVAMLMALGVAVPLGIMSAKKKDSFLDRSGMVAAFFGMSMPNYWLGLMLIFLFGVKLGWLPTGGRGTLNHLILPSLALAAGMWALFARLTRSLMIVVFSEDYIRTARAKGLKEGAVIFRHAVKNAMIPLITVIGIQVGQLISGTVIVETVFGWPGIGRLIVQAIFARDYPTIQASVLVLAVAFVVINLLVDVLYAYLDPRIKLK